MAQFKIPWFCGLSDLTFCDLLKGNVGVFYSHEKTIRVRDLKNSVQLVREETAHSAWFFI